MRLTAVIDTATYTIVEITKAKTRALGIFFSAFFVSSLILTIPSKPIMEKKTMPTALNTPAMPCGD